MSDPLVIRRVVGDGGELQVGAVLDTDDSEENDVTYEIERVIAETHYGHVYLARKLLLGSRTQSLVVLKEFRTDHRRLVDRPAAARMRLLYAYVRSEADISMLIEHRLRRRVHFPGDNPAPWKDKTTQYLLVERIVTLQPDVTDVFYYLVTRYIPDSVDLREFVRNVMRPMWRAGQAGRYRMLGLSVARQLALALADLHAAGIAHRDVKPTNAVVYWRAREDAPTKPLVFLIDFGHACAYVDPLYPLTSDPDEIEDRRFIRCSVPYDSTRAYLDPAASRDAPLVYRSGVSERVFLTQADVYSLAYTIYALFMIGDAPYDPQHRGQITRGTSAMPVGLVRLLFMMTEFDRQLRPSAADAAHSLERMMDHVDMRMRRPPPPPAQAAVPEASLGADMQSFESLSNENDDG